MRDTRGTCREARSQESEAICALMLFIEISGGEGVAVLKVVGSEGGAWVKKWVSGDGEAGPRSVVSFSLQILEQKKGCRTLASTHRNSNSYLPFTPEPSPLLSEGRVFKSAPDWFLCF